MPVAQPKILFLPKWYPDRNDPQIGVFIRKHAQAVSLYCDVKVLRIAPYSEMRKNFLIETNDADPEEHFVYYKPSTSGFVAVKKIVNFLRYYRAFNKGWKMLKQAKWQPDILHVHVMTRPGLMAYLKNWPLAKPFLISEHSSDYLNGKFASKGGYFKALNFRIFWKAKAITAVSQHLADGISALGLPGKIVVIPNVVDMPESIVPKRTKEMVRVLTVADLVDDIKNVSGIIRAVGSLMKDNAALEYHIIGGGPDADFLAGLVKKECLPDDRVVFHGILDNEKVFEHMAQADMVVINSRVETFALVVAEAIALGRPVVATRCGGPEAFVNEQTGILVDVENEEQLKEGIRKVIGELDRYDPEKMRDTLGEKYTRETIGAQFNELYLEIMSRN